MMLKNGQDATKKNDAFETHSSLDSLKVRTDDDLGRRMPQRAKKGYIYRGNVFLPAGSETATSRLIFSSRMIKATKAVVACGNDISTPRLCFDAPHKPARIRFEEDLHEGPSKERSRPVKIRIHTIEKDKPSPAGPRGLLENQRES